MRKIYPFFLLLMLFACNKMPITESQEFGGLDDSLMANIGGEVPFEYCVETELDAHTWKTFLEKNLMPDSLMIDSIPPGIYKVVVQFELEPNGSIVNAVVITDPGHGLGKFTLAVIKRYKEKPFVAEHPMAKSYRRQLLTFVFGEETCDEEPDELLL
jgi:hypothetical protein